MKMKLGAAASAVALLALMLSVVSAASASPRRTHELHLHLFQPANTDRITTVDANDTKNFDVGDYAIDTGPLYNAEGSRRLGSFKAIFTFVDKSHFSVHIVFLLPKGQIASDYVPTITEARPRFAITGGTAAYETVSGEGRAVVGANGETNFFFELVLLGEH